MFASMRVWMCVCGCACAWMGVRVFLVCVSVCVGGCVREGEESVKIRVCVLQKE